MRSRARAERGSALLIVFVFAAMVAIMLYEELPVAAFEAERNREQLVIDRGNEYAHAVKLFVRKIGIYPSSIDALENTNRMRFLRHRFKDPLTGQDDWRLLHAGPGGQLIDSKVNPLGNNQNANGSNGNGNNSSGNNTANNAGSSFGSSNNSASSGFGGFNSNSASNAPPEVIVPAVPQRAPAISANGGPSGQTVNAPPGDQSQNPMTPLLSSGQTASAGQTGQPGANPGDGSTTGTTAVGGPSPMDTVRNLLNNPNAPPQQTGSSSSQMGAINSGGIAGVASKAAGHSIKTVNDQSDYSLWEFYYDPTKDAMRGITGAQANGPAGPNAGLQNRPPVTTLGTDNTTATPTTTTTPTNPPQQTSTNPPQ